MNRRENEIATGELKTRSAEGSQWRDVSLRQTWRLAQRYRPCAFEGPGGG